jgi:hypothetical protein
MLLSAESALPCVAEKELASTTQAADPGGSLCDQVSIFSACLSSADLYQLSGWSWNRTNDLWFFRQALLPFGFLPPASCRRLPAAGFLPPELPNRIYVRGETRTPDLCLRSAALSFPTELHGQQLQGRDSNPRHPT